MRKSRKNFLVLMFIVCSLLLSSCGSNANVSNNYEVPDKYIEYAAQDLLGSNYLLPEKGYESYRFSTTHNTNKSAHTDDVNVTLYITYPCGEVVFQGSQAYQYSQSSDTWSEIKNWGWDKISESISSKSLIKTWTGSFYELDIEDVNFDARTVTCKYSITSTQGSPWTTGGVTEVTYTGHDTFSLTSSLGDNYQFIINESGESFYVELSAERGASLGYY